MSIEAISAEQFRANGVARSARRAIISSVTWLLAAKDELPRDWGPLPDAPRPESFPSWTSAARREAKQEPERT